MTKLKAHFDGKALILDEPVNLPLNCALEIEVSAAQNKSAPLAELARALEKLPTDEEWPPTAPSSMTIIFTERQSENDFRG